MITFINKAKVAINTYGPVKALFWMIFGYFRINKFIVYHMLLDENKECKGDDHDLLVKLLHPDELSVIRVNPEFNTYEVSISTYLKTSGCLVGYIDSSPVQINWLFRKGDDSRLFDLQENEAELNYCFTPASLRGRGIYVRMIKKIVCILNKQGVSDLYLATHETNKSAQKAINRAGFTKVGAITNYGVFYRPKWKAVKHE